MSQIIHMKKGEILMKEGDHSTSMYWIQSGSLRLFKRKGNGYIELGIVHSGELVGEMGFLDNQPRSASVEALQDCDIVEIPRGNFDEFMAAQPPWMKSLQNTLVQRLRRMNNRVRELESASTVYDKNEDGKNTKIHEFLSSAEILKLVSTLLLVGSRNSEKQADGTMKVKAGWFQLYGNQIFSIPLAKIQVFLDTLHEEKVIRIDKQKDRVDIYINDIDFGERFLRWLHEENARPDDKKTPITKKSMLIMNAIVLFAELEKAPSGAEEYVVDMEKVFQKSALANNTRIPFDWTAYSEIVQAGLSMEVLGNGQEKNAKIYLQKFLKAYPCLSLRQRFADLNEKKRSES